MQSIFYFPQTLLVTVQRGNWFPVQLTHRLRVYHIAQRKYDLRKNKWVRKAVVRRGLQPNGRNESGNQMPDTLPDEAIGLDVASEPRLIWRRARFPPRRVD